MTDTSSSDTDIVIVGLGPVGSTLANFLGQQGIRAVALDREASGYHLPRACTLDDEMMRVFQSLDLHSEVEQILEAGEGAHFVDAEDNILASWHRPREITPNGWYMNYRFHQPDLENVLRSGMKRYETVSEKWGAEVIAYDEDDKGVTVRFINLEDNTEESLRCKYVVGCDGARSFTRASMGASFDDLGFHETWLIMDFLLNEEETEPDRNTYHYCGGSRAGSKVFLGSKRKRWELRLTEDDDLKTITHPESVWPLVSRWISADEATLERAVTYTFHSTIADRWRRGRLMIAGDSAHQTPPFMGQGMCAGIRDAANLSWKLKQAIDTDDDKILDTYQSERRPHVHAYIDQTIKFGELINNTRLTLELGDTSSSEGGAQSLPQLKPRLGSGVGVGDLEYAGILFPQVKLSNGKLLDEEVGTRWALIVNSNISSTTLEVVTQLIENDHVAMIMDNAAELKQWFKDYSCCAVLLRPDRYIAGSVKKEVDISELVNID